MGFGVAALIAAAAASSMPPEAGAWRSRASLTARGAGFLGGLPDAAPEGPAPDCGAPDRLEAAAEELAGVAPAGVAAARTVPLRGGSSLTADWRAGFDRPEGLSEGER
eukprot:11881067-Alexandrium_andersonii.AAC.1